MSERLGIERFLTILCLLMPFFFITHGLKQRLP